MTTVLPHARHSSVLITNTCTSYNIHYAAGLIYIKLPYTGEVNLTKCLTTKLSICLLFTSQYKKA